VKSGPNNQQWSKIRVEAMSGYIREMRNKDASKVLEIYAYGLETRNATFETNVPEWKNWNEAHHLHSRFVYLEDGEVVGWVALAPVSHRYVYRGVAEVSLYLAETAFGRGIGTQLMNKVVESSEAHGIWTLYSNVFPENEATVRLHKKCGFREIGIRERIACLEGVWRDTIILERRSKVVGI
jgi:phosphinothricin acetyltransferase